MFTCRLIGPLCYSRRLQKIMLYSVKDKLDYSGGYNLHTLSACPFTAARSCEFSVSTWPSPELALVFSTRSSSIAPDASGLLCSDALICSMRSRREVKPGGAHWRDVQGLHVGSVYIYAWWSIFTGKRSLRERWRHSRGWRFRELSRTTRIRRNKQLPRLASYMLRID